VALNPDHAALLASAGYDRTSIAAAIADQAAVHGTAMAQSATWMSPPDLGRSYRCFRDPEDVVVLVAGGGGLYSAVFPSWCAGPHRNRAVTIEIEVGQACEIPGFAR